VLTSTYRGVTSLNTFRHRVSRHWQRTLVRRSQKGRLCWAKMQKLIAYWLPQPRVLHPHPEKRFAAPHPRSMRLECLPGLKQRLQAGKNTWPSIGAGSVSGIILGPLVMRHRYFGGFGLGHQFDSCA
jgi:hypothetical protein